jgi:hypothetical protein
MKTRREVLQDMIVTIGGASMLTACGGINNVLPWDRIAEGGSFYDQREMQVVARVSDLLIPRTETPGAIDVNIPGFLDGLMTDWANAATQQDHRAMLTQLDRDLSARAGGDFLTANGADAEQALLELDAAAFLNGDDYRPYRGFKSLVTQAYFSSEAGALEVQGWVAVPGRWDPCVDRQ